MKLNNKILYLTATGVISTLTPANTNAQTFYQCMPITCKAGEYKENNTCKKCPAGTYNPNTGSLTSADCKPCSAGYYSYAGASSCYQCYISVAIRCTYAYCNNGGCSFASSDSNRMITNDYPLSNNICNGTPSVTVGKSGHTCSNNSLSNNSLGYFSKSAKFVYGDKMGSKLTFTCDRTTGTVTSVDLK